jgi:hypothetical protein
MKNFMIYDEDGMGLVLVILWWKQNECTAVQALIHKCNGHGYICVIGEVTVYYGIYEIMAFDVCPVSSVMKSRIIFWRWHIHLERQWNMWEMKC